VSTKYLDSYVLSESSLFVYTHRFIMKTCGTTTLLRCLSLLFQFADELGMQLSWVGYSRKNFLFPSAQLWPHVNFGEEIRYIDTDANLSRRLTGHGHILGPVTGDHWFVYVAEVPSSRESSPASSRGTSGTSTPTAAAATTGPRAMVGAPPASTLTPSSSSEELQALALRRPPAAAAAAGSSSPTGTTTSSESPVPPESKSSMNRTLNMMMFDMDREVADIFFQGTNGLTGKQMTERAKIQALCPGFVIDEAAFQPCGYSMNAVLGSSYCTIHVTPEAECSYVSFETNANHLEYTSLVRTVLATFRPQRFVLTMFGDVSGMESLMRLPTDMRSFDIPQRTVVFSHCEQDAQGNAHYSKPRGESGAMQHGYYKRSSATGTTVEAQRQHCAMACYSFVPNSPVLTALPAPAVVAAAVASAAAAVNTTSAVPVDALEGLSDELMKMLPPAAAMVGNAALDAAHSLVQ
jgi:hypothetical protein